MLNMFDDEYNEYDAEDYDETDYDELDYEEDDNDSESLLHYWNNKSKRNRKNVTKRHSNTGCCLITLLVPILVIALVITVFAFSIKSYSYGYDSVKEAYKDGEPDYADGDLEDKLGDSGYYYDLFPEERDEEDDYSGGNYSSGSSKSFELTDEFIRNMPNLDTRTYRFEFPDGTTGHGTRSEYERIMREKYTYGAVQIGDKYYYKNTDRTFKTGWYQEKDKWYYFDLNTSALVMNELREINGRVYYFKPNGQMAQNEIVEIAGIFVKANGDGSCELVQ